MFPSVFHWKLSSKNKTIGILLLLFFTPYKIKKYDPKGRIFYVAWLGFEYNKTLLQSGVFVMLLNEKGGFNKNNRLVRLLI